MSNIASLEAERHRFLYVGMDIHKDNHTAIATNCFGQNLLELAISNSEQDFDDLVARVERLSKTKNLKPIFGLEDSYGYGLRLAKHFYKKGLLVKMIAPVLVDRERQYETHPEKSDSLDALGVAKVLIQRIDRLPNYSLSKNDEISKNIKELTLDREFLVKEQGRLKNQLHRLLHKTHNSEYRTKFKDPFSLKALKYWRRCPFPRKKNENTDNIPILKNQIRRKIKRLLDIKEEVKEIEQELNCLIQQTNQKIETLNGCGTVLGLLGYWQKSETLTGFIRLIPWLNMLDFVQEKNPREKPKGILKPNLATAGSIWPCTKLLYLKSQSQAINMLKRIFKEKSPKARQKFRLFAVLNAD
jgi:transposase